MLAVPTVAVVPAERVRPLRTRVLRPEWADRLLAFEQDDDAVHVAAHLGGDVVGVATVYAAEPPAVLAEALRPSFQLRGMATAETARGQGVGAAVLAASVAAVRAAGGVSVWCNARTSVAAFYARHGWAEAGKPFDVPGIGPHVVMGRAA